MTDAKQSTPLRAKYRILMEIGRGGMGAVHLALTRGPQGFVKLVVLKMLLPELIVSETARRMFLEEARISARIAHPNLVQVFEVLEYEGAPTMVMEYLEGRPLSTILSDDPHRLPLRMHVYVIGQVLAGLHAAHELRDYDGTPLGLIHRDVSPHNVFLQFDGRVKVLDFGIAKAARSEVETQTGELKGKLRYMAPEQLRGDPEIDRRADLFSVGVMLWEALAGRRMWDAMSDADVMLRLLNGEVPALPDDPRIHPGLAAVCRKALEPRADSRYSTAAELAQAIEAHAGDLSQGGRADDLRELLLAQFGQAYEATHRLIDAHIKAAELVAEEVPPAAVDPTTRDGDRTEIGSLRSGARQRAEAVRGAGLWALGATAVAAAATAGWLWIGHPHSASTHGGGGAAAWLNAQAPGGATSACAPGFKSCGGECVSTDRPDVGCGSDDCRPCDVANATARCNAHHACDIAVCYQEFDNCDGQLANGCETEVRVDPDNCGACGHKCPPLPHARTGCGDTCTIWRCDEGFHDCNGVAGDGCEVRTSDDVKNCGHCGLACARGQHCRAGHCVL
ncbi:MAG: protein kinase [Polyangiaceae bacterium]|nr:protein kinase [Polyangiaceae bacterium]